MHRCRRIQRTTRLMRIVGLTAAAALLAACGSGTAAPKPAGTAPSSASAPAATPAPSSKSASGSASTPVSSGSTSASAAKPLKKVTLYLSWIPSGYDAPNVLSKDKGYYKQAGFDVKITPGKGSVTTAEVVANSSGAFGTADAGSVSTLISKGAPLKVLAVFIQQSPLSFIYLPPFKLTDLHQLVGKTVLDQAGSTTYKFLPAVLATAGMKTSQLHIDFVKPSTYGAVLERHPKDIVLGYNSDDLQDVQKVDPQATYTPYSKFGINTLNVALYTTLNRLKEDPAGVRRFVAATIKGWQDTIKDPAAAVNDLVAMFPGTDKSVETAELKQSLTMLHTPATKGKLIGWMARSDWKNTIDLLHKYGLITQTPKPLDDYYTDAYLPKQ